MRITVRFFAVLRERTGKSAIELDLCDEASVSDALKSIGEKFSSARLSLEKIAVAVNREYVDREKILRDGDELALIPPVSGG